MEPITVLGLISFIPAIVILYFVLGEFEAYFKDNKAFFMIILGLGLGMALGFVSLFFDLLDFLEALLVIALIEVIKFFILFQRPFRLNHDSTFYGLALGTGIGAMVVFVYSYAVGTFWIGEDILLDLRTGLFFFLISYNYTLVNGGTGAIIGYGSYLGDFWLYLGKGFMISGLHGLMMTMVWTWVVMENFIGAFLVMIVGSVYATAILYYIYTKVIPESIPKELKEKVQKVEEDGKD